MSPNQPLEVVCGIIVHDDFVLATRRAPERSMPLLWEFPGGKLEEGESAEGALHRELQEELNLKVSIVESLDSVDHKDDENNIRLTPFVCKVDQPSGPVPIDHVEIRWIKIQESGQLTWAPADIPLVENLSKLNINHE